MDNVVLVFNFCRVWGVVIWSVRVILVFIVLILFFCILIKLRLWFWIVVWLYIWFCFILVCFDYLVSNKLFILLVFVIVFNKCWNWWVVILWLLYFYCWKMDCIFDNCFFFFNFFLVGDKFLFNVLICGIYNFEKMVNLLLWNWFVKL